MCTLVTCQWIFAASTVQFAEGHSLEGWIDGETGHSLVAHMPVPIWFFCSFVVIQAPTWPLFAGAS